MRITGPAPAIILSCLAFIISSCSKPGPDPRKVVIEFLERDMASSDTAAIKSKLDMGSIVKEQRGDLLAAGDSIRANNYTADSLIRDLISGGELNTRWLAYQIIISNVTQKKDSAEVEVSFIDPARSTQYYNRIGLRLVRGEWKIYTFKTLK